MNCYICREETGNCSHPALAFCQYCGAGMCESHVIEWTPIPATGMAGTSRCLLICSRCHHVLSQPRWPHSARPTKEKPGSDTPAERPWWKRGWRRRPSDLPEPEAAVKEVERFLHLERS
jgi:hypothetical protein